MWMVVPALVGAVAVSACGGSHHVATGPSDQEQITQVLRSLISAETRGDGQTACQLLTAAGQRQLQALVVKQTKGIVPITPSCQDAVGLVHTFAGTKLLSALGNARIERVKVHAAEATAEIVDGTAFAPQTVSLMKLAGAWRIAGVPSLTG